MFVFPVVASVSDVVPCQLADAQTATTISVVPAEMQSPVSLPYAVTSSQVAIVEPTMVGSLLRHEKRRQRAVAAPFVNLVASLESSYSAEAIGDTNKALQVQAPDGHISGWANVSASALVKKAATEEYFNDVVSRVYNDSDTCSNGTENLTLFGLGGYGDGAQKCPNTGNPSKECCWIRTADCCELPLRETDVKQSSHYFFFNGPTSAADCEEARLKIRWWCCKLGSPTNYIDFGSSAGNKEKEPEMYWGPEAQLPAQEAARRTTDNHYYPQCMQPVKYVKELIPNFYLAYIYECTKPGPPTQVFWCQFAEVAPYSASDTCKVGDQLGPMARPAHPEKAVCKERGGANINGGTPVVACSCRKKEATLPYTYYLWLPA
jgi:hypothetical protein